MSDWNEYDKSVESGDAQDDSDIYAGIMVVGISVPVLLILWALAVGAVRWALS